MAAVPAWRTNSRVCCLPDTPSSKYHIPSWKSIPERNSFCFLSKLEFCSKQIDVGHMYLIKSWKWIHLVQLNCISNTEQPAGGFSCVYCSVSWQPIAKCLSGKNYKRFEDTCSRLLQGQNNGNPTSCFVTKEVPAAPKYLGTAKFRTIC
jgi:hypothetical protein